MSPLDWSRFEGKSDGECERMTFEDCGLWPKLEAQAPRFRPGQDIIQIMVRTRLADSNSEAKRLLAQGAVALNGQIIRARVLDRAQIAALGEDSSGLCSPGFARLDVGKRHRMVRLTPRPKQSKSQQAA